MTALFLDCTPELLPLWRRAYDPDVATIDVNIATQHPGNVPQLLSGYEICVDDHCYMSKATLAQCVGLKHIVFLGTGAASFIDIPAAKDLGIQVSAIHGYGNRAVAEHTIALVLASARSIARMDRDTRRGRWRTLEGIQVEGKTLGVIGLGGIGRHVARLGAALGMRVIAWNRSPMPDCAVPLAQLDDVLREADILSLHLALCDETTHFLDCSRLARTKPGVVLINTARAALVDEQTLLRYLTNGHIGHAALDVFWSEPLAADHPLAHMDNVTLTAHAGFMTPEATLNMLRQAIEIVRALQAGFGPSTKQRERAPRQR